MKYLIALLIFILPSLACGQSARIALALAETAEGETVQVKAPTYAELRAKAIAENRPLLVWIGVWYISHDGLEHCLHYHTGNFFGDVEKGLIVGMPRYGSLWSAFKINVNSTNEYIKAKAKETWDGIPNPNPPPVAVPGRSIPLTFPTMNFGGGGSRGRSC